MHERLGKLMMIFAALMVLTPQTSFAQRAGALIAAVPVDGAPAGMRAWRVQYWSSDNGKPIRITGMVIAPDARSEAGPRRVIAWEHGLIGISKRCAPSAGMTNFTTIPELNDAVRRGYVVVAPDYPGLGSDMVHPVLVGHSAGSSVLDAVRSARAIPEADAGSRFALWGESQGGHAALWAGQMASSYAPRTSASGHRRNRAADRPCAQLPRGQGLARSRVADVLHGSELVALLRRADVDVRITADSKCHVTACR